ncbi:MAG: VOC family protein [Acidimicrobiales bacterium]
MEPQPESGHSSLGHLELGYLVLEVPEPASLDAFFGEVIGLAPGARPHSFRNDEAVHRLIVESGDANDLVVTGLEAADDAAFEATVARLTDAGHPVVDAEPADAAARSVARLATVAAPWGGSVEIVSGLERGDAPDLPAMPGGFLTDGVGGGHAVVATTAFDESHDFLVDGLGFGQSDWLEMELGPGMTLEVRFYHCNPRHHTIALARAPFELPQRLHHLMVETRERDDVGAAFDRVWASDLAIPNGLGRHDNDGMFSFYVQSPAGFQVEVGHGARVVGDDWDDNRRYDRISAWGHQPLERP